MSVLARMEIAVNEHLTPIAAKMMEVGEAGKDTGLGLGQKKTALLIAGILTGVKVQIMQAGKFVEEAHLDNLMD